MFQERLIRALALASEINTSSLAKLALETELRQAIDCNEFVLYFQPKLDMESNRIVTLVRNMQKPPPRPGRACAMPRPGNCGLGARPRPGRALCVTGLAIARAAAEQP